MDINESHVEQWLQDQEYTNIQFVTDTNDQPPDFIVNDSIAVEVRRLNWMFGHEDQGLESIEYPLRQDIVSGLEAAEQPPRGHKVYVSCDLLHTELPDKRVVINEVRIAANRYIKCLKESVRHGQRPPHSRFETSFRMSIDFIAGTNSSTNEFELMDVEAGVEDTGWVANDSIDNINRCINEKTNKIKDKHDLYAEWWLILVEHNVHPTVLRNSDELETVRNDLTDTNLWSRITILSNLEGVPHLDLI